MSLFFVGITLVEFAAILLLKEHLQKVPPAKQCLRDASGKIQPIKIIPGDSQFRTNSIEAEGQIYKTNLESQTSDAIIKSIDNATCVLFLITYLIFNSIYWAYYLSKA